MGILHDIVSDAAREGYELGKGPWDDDFVAALRSDDPVGEVMALMVEEGFEPLYATEVARECAAFVAAHPDWRVVNDAQCDIDVVDDTERADLIAEGADPDDPHFPIYRKVGSRYRGERDDERDGERASLDEEVQRETAEMSSDPRHQGALKALHQLLDGNDGANLRRAAGVAIPRRLYRQYQIGATVDGDELVFRPLFLSEADFGPRAFAASRLLLVNASPADLTVVLGGEDVDSARSSDFDRWREPGERAEGMVAYGALTMLPLLRVGDSARLRVRRTADRVFGALLGTCFEPESDVQCGELAFDSVEQVPPGEVVTLSATAESVMRFQRAWVPGGKHFCVEQIRVEGHKQLAVSDVSVEFLFEVPLLGVGFGGGLPLMSPRAGGSVEVDVRAVGRARRFRLRLGGETVK